MRYGRFTVDLDGRKAGGQAFVYFTVDPDTGEEVAVKVARPSAWSARRMKAEIEAQTRLDHPNVLKLLEHDADEGWHVTLRADGSLEEIGPFLPNRWAYVRAGLVGVTSAVAHAHTLGFVHRDLSPGNVLVFEGGWVVADWGFVLSGYRKGQPRMTEPLERFGTPEFMAPEMVIDPRNAKEPTDIYSIGRLASWATSIERGDGKNDDPITAWWRLLITRTTEIDPVARWTMQDLRAHLRSTLTSVSPLSSGSQRVAGHRNVIPLRRDHDICAQCGHAAGYDASDRCLVCHAAAGY